MTYLEFPGKVKPVRKGVYQRLCDHSQAWWYAYWDGNRWYSYCGTREGAVAYYRNGQVSSYPELNWRGLAERY